MSTAPSATPTPVVFIFENVPNMTVCGMGQVSWLYSGDPSNTLGFAITNDNIGAIQNTSSPNTWALFILDGSTTPLTNQGTYSWSPVELDTGIYTVVAAVPETNQLFTSLEFSVLPGEDPSCLTATTSGASSIIPSTTSLSTTTATNIGVVQGQNAGSSKMGSGAVAGIVIGALAAAGLLIAAILLFRRCRRGRGGVGRFGKHERRPSRLFEKKGWLQSGNNGTFGGNIVSGGAVGLVKSPTKMGFGDLKDGTLDGERGLHLDDSNYGKGLDLGFGTNNYPHRLSYADQARNHAENVGASSSEEDVSGRFPAQHSPDFAREYSMFTPANRTVAVPLAIHRAGHAHHAHRGSVAESILSDSTVVGSPQSAKLAGSFPFTRPRPAPRQSSEFAPTSVPASPSAEVSQDPFASPPSTPSRSPAPSEAEAHMESVGHGSALSHARAHLISATVSGGDGTQLPVSLFHPSSQYIAPSPRSTFPQSVSASDLSVAPSMSSEFDAGSYSRPSGDLYATHGLGLGFMQAPGPPSRRTLSARKPVPYSSSEALELSARSSPTGERNSHSGIGRSSSDSSGHDWSSAAALSHASMPGGGAVGRTSTSSRSTASETHLTSPSSPYSPTTTLSNAPAAAVSSHLLPHDSISPFAGMKGLPELNHKSSFGDKPMHYLMPDPPAPQMQ